jgi:peptidoglycan/xylan/chitin deacetylase (PgdA/CDA1 family)
VLLRRGAQTKGMIAGALLLSLNLGGFAALIGPGAGVAAASHASPSAVAESAAAERPAGRCEPGRSTPGSTANPRRAYHAPILMYHRIGEHLGARDALPGLVVSPQAFAAQLEAFTAEGWHSITLAALARAIEADAAIPPKTLVITLDDGWDDSYAVAFPIMRRLGFVGTFFVIGGRIGSPGALSAQEMRTLEVAGDEIGNHTESHVPLTTVSATRFRREVESASDEISAAIGHRPVTLAYPMGKVNAAVIAWMNDMPDVKIAVTTESGTCEEWSARYKVPRLRVGPETDPAGLLALAGR